MVMKALHVFFLYPGAYCIKLLPEPEIKTQVKSENSGKHNFAIDCTIGENWLKITSFSPVKVLCNRPLDGQNANS